MDAQDNRQIARDSLFVLADMRLDGVDGEYRVKVRNLSAGGLMGEGPVRVARGMQVWIDVRNIGWTEGTVAWVHDTRFGVAFAEEIDPKVARAPVCNPDSAPRFVRVPLRTVEPTALRKV